MNKIFTLLSAALLFGISAKGQSFFFEDFDDCEIPSGWTNNAVLGDTAWVFGDNSAGDPNGNVDGSCMAYIHDDDLGSGAPSVVADLISPIVDLTSLDTALLQFDYVFEDIGGSYFAVALWNGADWDTVFTENSDPGCFGFFPTCGPRSASISIEDYLIEDFRIKFIYDDNDSWAWYIGLDNVSIYVPPTDDAVAVSALSPLDGCGLSASETVSIIVANNGQNDITSIDATFEVGAQSETETFTVSLAPSESDTLTFTATADLSTVGDYDFTAWVTLANDLDNTNDTVNFSVTNIPVLSTLPYSENFENGAGGWIAGGTNSTWELGEPAGTLINEANSPSNAWVTNLDGDYENSELSFVESPCMDFSALTVDPVFRFAHIFDTENCCDEGFVDISYDAGATWLRLGNAGEGENWYDDTFNNEWDGTGVTSGGTEWRIAEHLLDSAAGESSVKIRIGFSSDGSVTNEGFGFDDIEIFEQPAVNASVNEILSPVSGCALGASEEVTIVIENSGDDFLVDFNVEYDAGSGIVTEVVTDTLFASEIDTFTFSTTVDLSTLGEYDFAAWTAVSGDGDPGNDTLATTITNIPVLSGLPYEEDFESGAGGWITGGTSSSWELGEPIGTFIDTANSGVNAWVTNLDGDYNASEFSYIESPCMDFSSLLIDPILEFAHIYETESCCDEGYVDVSVDGGNTWNRLGAFGEGENWYNDEFNDWWDGTSGNATEWRTATHLIDGAAGESSVKIRFVFSSDGSIQNEGFGVDDISITEQPPVNSEAVAVVSPMSSCGLTSTEEVTLELTNLGSLAMDSVIIGYIFDNGTPFIEVVDSVIQPNDTVVFTFSQTVDLSVSGDYDLTVWTGTIGDGDTSNDTINLTITSVPTVATLPYSQDFENGTGGWVSGGTPTVWELGEPEGTFIDTANSGINAWVTVLDGDYPSLGNDSVYLESPCFDFSGLTEDPVIRFAGIFETESCCDEGWVDISLDGGLTWAKLGAAGEGENWYNDQFDDFWNGLSGNPNEWQNAEHLLDGAAGEANVKVRFVFSSDGSIVNEGFGLDDISIFPQPELDLVALSMDEPQSGCSLDQEEVTMTFWNKGTQDVSNFELGFIVDGGTAQTETYTATVASGDTVSYTFATEFADLSAVGPHTLDVFTSLTGDEDVTSDSIFGYDVENFENTPLSQSIDLEGAVISSDNVEPLTSEMFFCGLPTSLDGCLEIESVTIDSLAHTWLSDLDMFLISPAGDTVELSTDNGGSGDNMVGVVFTDTASSNITSQTAGIAPGYYAVEDTAGFAGLYNGQDPNGGWTLWINDDTGGDNGELVKWSMTFRNNNPSPELNYSSDTTICLTHVLTVEVAEYDSYLWSTGDNAQSVELFGDLLGLGTTDVYVSVDENGCSGTSDTITVTVDACAGIDELSGLNIDVYPNPTKGEVILDVTGDSDGFMVNILDVNGKSVYSQSTGVIASHSRKAIDLSHVAKGVYFIQLLDGQTSVTRKLIKQ
jgi:subtilisin-like proprotein convertase family protein